MEPLDIAKLAGALIGAIVASVVATMVMFQRMLKAQAPPDDERPTRPPQLQNAPLPSDVYRSMPPRESARLERLEEDVRRLEEHVRDLAEQIGKRLTTEEFQAYTAFVTGTLQAMTEKVGELRGQLSGIAKGGRG